MMNKLIFKNLYIFSAAEKLAKSIKFTDGINVVTSSQVDGTDRGKSVIMRSLYYTLGADCYFDDNWKEKEKTFILQFELNDKNFYMYRSDRLFKFFDSSRQLLFTTIHRHELAEKLNDYFKFAVQLPNKENNKLEITPAVYNYLLSFIDQDYYEGTYFVSFKSLSEYANFKENMLYYHFGVFTQEYFEIQKQIEILKEQKNQLVKKQEMVANLIDKTDSEIKENTFSQNLDTLRVEVEKGKEEYSSIVSKLHKLRNKLIELRNQKHEIETTMSELKAALTKDNRDIKDLSKHICPYCKSQISHTLKLRTLKYNFDEDVILLMNSAQQDLEAVVKEIEIKEANYQTVLDMLKVFEDKLKLNTIQINDILRHKGFIEVRNNLLNEYGEISGSIQNNDSSMKSEKQKLKKYLDIKKKINETYYTLLLDDKTSLGLKELDTEKFIDISHVFRASGSNKPIVTLIWYMTLTKIKNKFNEKAIKFPLVFDSPNNAEMDDNKKKEVISYILKNATESNQVIISAIGFNKEEWESKIPINEIILTNEKYKLLNKEDFLNMNYLLNELCVK